MMDELESWHEEKGAIKPFDFLQWESSKKECVHINYLKNNKDWYLVVGYVGLLEIMSEDGQKRLFSLQSSDFQSNDRMIEASAFLCSVEGHVKGGCGNYLSTDYFMVGTSRGEIYQLGLTL